MDCWIGIGQIPFSSCKRLLKVRYRLLSVVKKNVSVVASLSQIQCRLSMKCSTNTTVEASSVHTYFETATPTRQSRHLLHRLSLNLQHQYGSRGVLRTDSILKLECQKDIVWCRWTCQLCQTLPRHTHKHTHLLFSFDIPPSAKTLLATGTLYLDIAFWQDTHTHIHASRVNTLYSDTRTYPTIMIPC